MVYDEGIEVAVRGETMLLFLGYGQTPDTEGESYCDRTSHGWVRDVHGLHGCARARRVDADSQALLEMRSRGVDMPGHAAAVGVHRHRAAMRAARAVVESVPPPKWQWPFHEDQLPKRFSWRNASGTDWTDHLPMRTQGDCGSCYAIAAVDMASVRLRIASSGLARIPLSPQDAMACSPYSQGCAGGFPFTASRFLTEAGTRSESCIPYSALDGHCARRGRCKSPRALSSTSGGRANATATVARRAQNVDTALLQASAALGPAGIATASEADAGLAYHMHRARAERRAGGASAAAVPGAEGRGAAVRYRFAAYRYVGGYYGACSEPEMRAEVFHKGPLAVTFYSPASLMAYRGGVLRHSAEDTRAAHELDASRRVLRGTTLGESANTPGGEVGPAVNASREEGTSPALAKAAVEFSHEWEETTHSALLVGWGETEDGQRYWEVRNEWGRDWGEDGHFRIARGTDECAIESMAVSIDPLLEAFLYE